MQLILRSLYILALLSITPTAPAQVYKYQDAEGNWHFSDKKPETTDTKVETLSFKSQSNRSNKPKVQLSRSDQQTRFVVKNPYFAPIQVFLKLNDKVITKVVEENSQTLLFKSEAYFSASDYQFSYTIGSPDSKHSQTNYLPPFSDFKPMKVTQSFKGKFSHHSQPSLYAIDLGMTVGTKITAARSGKVIYARDSYSTAGVSSPFFIDKANVVGVLHDDGTYAVYAHLLLGSIKVRAGDTVEAGQILALSGNTGYSTGPHLHFVIRKNKNGRSVSLPFKLLQKGEPLTPKQGMWLLPTPQN